MSRGNHSDEELELEIKSVKANIYAKEVEISKKRQELEKIYNELCKLNDKRLSARLRKAYHY